MPNPARRRKQSPPRSRRPAYATFERINLTRLATGALFGLASCGPVTHYDYTHLPSGYHWRAVYDRSTNAIVFYGRDPLTMETVYVGPDGRYFVYRHAGPIGPKDLREPWVPHDAR